jgi:SAM-dependent methyltransferase
LHFTDPIPSALDIQEFYKGDYHVNLRAEGATEQEFGTKFRHYVRWIRKFVPSGRALDIGCATGLLPRMLADEGYAAEGIELNAESARWGARHYRIPIHVGSLESFSPATARYDLITLTDVLEHTRNPLRALQHAHRLLGEGGYLMITLPDIKSPESRYYQCLSMLTRRPQLWVTCHIPFHIWEFTRSAAERCFREAGFTLIGFRRAPEEGRFKGRLAFISVPVWCFNLPPLCKYFGTRMEFILKKAPAGSCLPLSGFGAAVGRAVVRGPEEC